jgi:hypothetical protein
VALINFVAHLHTLDTVINNYHIMTTSTQTTQHVFPEQNSKFLFCRD